MKENIYRVKLGSAFQVIDETRNLSDVLFTPDGGVTYDVVDPDGVVVVDGASMTEASTGVWTATTQGAASWMPGIYTLVTYAVHGVYTSIKEYKNAFEIY